MDRLSNIEQGGVASASRIQANINAVPLSAQATIDVDARSIKERLLDPIVMSMAVVSLLLALILLIVLLAH